MANAQNLEPCTKLFTRAKINPEATTEMSQFYPFLVSFDSSNQASFLLITLDPADFSSGLNEDKPQIAVVGTRAVKAV